MSEPWFLAPERCEKNGAVMRVKGHENCRCQSCVFEFRPFTGQSADHMTNRLMGAAQL